MIAALEDETVRMSDPLDFSQIISTTMLKRLLIAAVIVAIVKAALIVEFPDYFKALAERLINPEKQYPTKTRIVNVKILDKDYKPTDPPPFVARGEDVPVEVTLDEKFAVPPQGGMLKFINFKTDASIPVELVPAGGVVFKGTLAKALEDVDLVVEIGDVRTKRMPIKVVARPEVDTSRSIESVRYQLPAYTEEPPPPPQKFGALSALQGSIADIQFTATKPLKSALIERSDGRKYPMIKTPPVAPKDPAAPRDPEGMNWRASNFPMDKSGQFHVVLVDENGLKNSTPALEYPIDARPDLAPTIKLLKPSHDMTVTPTARLSVKYNARDDYGLRVVWLAYYIQVDTDTPSSSDGSPEKAQKRDIKKVEFKIDRDPATKRLRKDLLGATVPFDLGEIKAKIGDQIVFWLECDDFCDTNDEVPARRANDGSTIEAPPGTKVYPRTQDVKLTVISRQDKEAELRAELARLYQQVERHEKTEEEIKTKSLEIFEMIQKLK